jgi:hypothetical protein
MQEQAVLLRIREERNLHLINRNVTWKRLRNDFRAKRNIRPGGPHFAVVATWMGLVVVVLCSTRVEMTNHFCRIYLSRSWRLKPAASGFIHTRMLLFQEEFLRDPTLKNYFASVPVRGVMNDTLQNFTMGFIEKIWHELRFSEKYKLQSSRPRTRYLGIVTTTKALYHLFRSDLVLPHFGGPWGEESRSLLQHFQSFTAFRLRRGETIVY